MDRERDSVMSYVELFEAGIVIEDDDDEVSADTLELELEDQELMVEAEGDSDVPVEAQFAHFLLEERALASYELDEVLREQAAQPGIRLGEIIAYLGYLPSGEIERLRGEFSRRA